MKLNIAIILSIVVAVGVVALGFTIYQISSERDKLNGDLVLKTGKTADILTGRNLNFLKTQNEKAISAYEDSLCNEYHLEGIIMYINADSIIPSNNECERYMTMSADYISQSINAAGPFHDFFDDGDRKIFQYINPVTSADGGDNAVILYTDATYIDNIISSIWMRNFIRWFLQALIVSFVTVVIIRWGILSPINKISEWVKALRIGNLNELGQKAPAGFLVPLHKEIVHITKAMHEARAIAEEEARLRTNAEAVWTHERLKAEIENTLAGQKMIVVSNREPYMHIHEGKEIKCIVPASGMITAMEPILKASGGLWIASGTGDADRGTTDENDRLKVPPENPTYTLKRVWLTKEEEDHFYYGFSNEGMWPLCHIAHTRPTFRSEDWNQYVKVNERFASVILQETKNEESPLILIQDYHFALLPHMIKKMKPGSKVAIFWHIPWPNPESFGICPWQKEILQGMLGADLIGFHTQYHCNHFLETVSGSIESRVAWESFRVKIGEHHTQVKPFPISIPFTLKDPESKLRKLTANELLAEYGISAAYTGIGVDRMDYTKGIREKFLAVEKFLEKNSSYTERFTFIQIGAPSRTLIKSYADTINEIEKEAERINWRFKSKNWKPILLLKKHHSHDEILPFYSSSDLCLVSSLHDGMNLVAKEYVSCRDHNDGVLILSRFAGASHELNGSLIINPYDIEKTADAILTALEMTHSEQEVRMKQMRQSIASNNIYYWAASLLKTMTSIPSN